MGTVNKGLHSCFSWYGRDYCPVGPFSPSSRRAHPPPTLFLSLPFVWLSPCDQIGANEIWTEVMWATLAPHPWKQRCSTSLLSSPRPVGLSTTSALVTPGRNTWEEGGKPKKGQLGSPSDLAKWSYPTSLHIQMMTWERNQPLSYWSHCILGFFLLQ